MNPKFNDYFLFNKEYFQNEIHLFLQKHIALKDNYYMTLIVETNNDSNAKMLAFMLQLIDSVKYVFDNKE